MPANGLKWCTSRSALICVGNPDQIARRHIGNLTNSGHSALKAHVCCGPHYDNIIYKYQYSLYRYLPTFCTHFIKLSAPNSCLCTVSSRTCEYTRDYGGALKPPKPSAQFWAIAQIRRLLKTPTSDINNRTVLACFFSAAVAQVLKPRNSINVCDARLRSSTCTFEQFWETSAIASFPELFECTRAKGWCRQPFSESLMCDEWCVMSWWWIDLHRASMYT